MEQIQILQCDAKTSESQYYSLDSYKLGMFLALA